jgi:uncharacterized membrane protein
MIIGYVLLCLLLVTVGTAASSLYLEHKKLLSAADGAAMAAADSYTLGQLGGTAQAPSASLSASQVRGAALEYLAGTGARDHFSQLELGADTGSPDSHSATVTLTAVAHPWFVNFLVPDGIPITATSTARARLQR